MIKSEVSMGTGWFKITKEDRAYIEINMAASQFSRDIRLLEKEGTLNISTDKYRKYKLINYALLK